MLMLAITIIVWKKTMVLIITDAPFLLKLKKKRFFVHVAKVLVLLQVSVLSYSMVQRDGYNHQT